MYQIVLKALVTAMAALFLLGCSGEPDGTENGSSPSISAATNAESSDNGQTVPPTSYTEYLQCDFGEAYSPEAFRAFLTDWNAEIDQLPDRGLRAFGYLPRAWSSEAFDGIWVLRWPNIQERDAGWKEYAEAGVQERLRSTHPDLIECAPENELGLFAFDTYSRRSAPESWNQSTSPYSVSMQICAMNDDRPLTDLRDFVTSEYLPYLAQTDSRLEGNTYWYQVAVMDEENSIGQPSTASAPFDFVWMNYWNNIEEETTSMEDWAANGGKLQEGFDAIATCQDPIPYDGHYFRTASSS